MLRTLLLTPTTGALQAGRIDGGVHAAEVVGPRAALPASGWDGIARSRRLQGGTLRGAATPVPRKARAYRSITEDNVVVVG